MQYTVWNRGRLIGRTDLGFRRLMSGIRCGWFHPVPGAERVMHVVSAVPSALRAVVQREVSGEMDGESPGQSAACRSTEAADLAEAFQHLDALELELRREDGSVVPATDIGIQDMLQLVELSRSNEPSELDGGEWDADDGLFDTMEFDPAQEPFLGDEDEMPSVVDEQPVPVLPPRWSPDDADLDGEPSERYQILVTIADDDALP